MKKHYQKYCMHLAYAIISATFALFSTKALSQESSTFTITEGTIKHMKSKYMETHSILHDTVIATKRPALFIGNEIVDNNEIIGFYSILPSKYRYARRY